MKTGHTSESGRSHRHSHSFTVNEKGNGKTTRTIISPGSARRADSHTHVIGGGRVSMAKGHPHDKPGGHNHLLVSKKTFMAIPKSYKKAAAAVYAAKGGKAGLSLAAVVMAAEKKLGRKLTPKEVALLKAKMAMMAKGGRRGAARTMRSVSSYAPSANSGQSPKLPMGYGTEMKR